MKIKNLVKNLDCKIFGSTEIEIEKLSFDSRKIAKNMLFFCINGTKVDGNMYIAQAKQNGAVAIVTSQRQNVELVQIIVSDVRKAMAKISSNFFGNPDKKLIIIGITGTNGKTSTSYLISDLLKSFNKRVGVIGTSGIFVGEKKFEAEMTTPDSIELFYIF